MDEDGEHDLLDDEEEDVEDHEETRAHVEVAAPLEDLKVGLRHDHLDHVDEGFGELAEGRGHRPEEEEGGHAEGEEHDHEHEAEGEDPVPHLVDGVEDDARLGHEARRQGDAADEDQAGVDGDVGHEAAELHREVRQLGVLYVPIHWNR